MISRYERICLLFFPINRWIAVSETAMQCGNLCLPSPCIISRIHIPAMSNWLSLSCVLHNTQGTSWPWRMTIESTPSKFWSLLRTNTSLPHLRTCSDADKCSPPLKRSCNLASTFFQRILGSRCQGLSPSRYVQRSRILLGKNTSILSGIGCTFIVVFYLHSCV